MFLSIYRKYQFPQRCEIDSEKVGEENIKVYFLIEIISLKKHLTHQLLIFEGISFPPLLYFLRLSRKNSTVFLSTLVQ